MKIVLALALALATSSPLAADYQETPKGTVRVDCGFGAGTAVKIGFDTYVTAAHVVDTPGCRVDGKLIENVAIQKNDFATFKGPASTVQVKYSCKGFKKGEYYVAKGYALGGYEIASIPWQATPFVLEGFQTFMGDGIPGMSGGPVVNKRGEIVGVVNLRWPARSISLSNTVICRK